MAQLLFYDEATHTYAIDGIKVPSVTEIVGLLNSVDMNNPMIRQAAVRGSLVHEYCEAIDYGAAPDEVEPELVGYLRAYNAFLRDYRPDWLYVERPLYSAVHGYAGTLDRLGCIDGKITIVDLKTNASFDRTAKIKLACQLFGYAEMFEERYAIKVQDRFGVQLKKDGTYTVHNPHKHELKYGFDAERLFWQLLEITKITGGYKWQKN